MIGGVPRRRCPAPLPEPPDVLAFSTEPLEVEVEVTGPIEAAIHLSSDAPDTDVFVMLQDVYPPSEDWPGAATACRCS